MIRLRRLAGGLTLVWWLAITWLSTRGGVSLPSFNLLQTDKIGHAAAYALLSFLLLTVLSPTSIRKYFYVFVLAFGYGVLMEWVQYRFFPNRFFEVDDMVANGIGATCAIVFFYLLQMRKKGF